MFHRRGGPEALVYEDVADPEPGPDEVLVRVRACGVNHMDIYVREGSHGMKAPLPHIGGLESVGEVAATGSAVADWEIGARVLVLSFTADGTCESCRSGRDNLCAARQIIGVNRDGGFAEYVAVPGSALLRIPDHIPFVDAAALQGSFGTAWHMLVDRARLQPGETVLVLAAGSGVGSAAVQLARHLGCTVIATAGSEEKRTLALALGAQHVLPTAGHFDREVLRLTGGRGADVVAEHIGPDTWTKSVASLRIGGRLVTCGGSSGRMAATDLWSVFWKELTVLGSMGVTRADMVHVLGLVGDGAVSPVIDRTFPLSATREAQVYLAERRAFGKVVIVPEE
ncbi:MAG: hypothetical protein HW391_728 [Chloroflexi bacterium]|nr:hypothetical protein [Chloroflexota bacterium]